MVGDFVSRERSALFVNRTTNLFSLSFKLTLVSYRSDLTSLSIQRYERASFQRQNHDKKPTRLWKGVDQGFAQQHCEASVNTRSSSLVPPWYQHFKILNTIHKICCHLVLRYFTQHSLKISEEHVFYQIIFSQETNIRMAENLRNVSIMFQKQ